MASSIMASAALKNFDQYAVPVAYVQALASIGRVANLSKARGLEGAAGPEAVVQVATVDQ